MDRRRFIALSAAGVANLALCDQLSLIKALTKDSHSSYNIVILGDTHYDTEPSTLYHAKYVDPNPASDKLHRAEWVRNGEMWRERCPKLVKRAYKLIDSQTKFILQMGDLIQGDCGDPEVHKKFLEDAVNMMKKNLARKLPFVTVVGNHDIRGTKAKEAYHEFMPKVMSRELGMEITKTSFHFSVGDDAFIVIDFNHPEADLFDRMLDETRGARHTFIVSHGTVFPSVGGYPRWYLYGGQKNPENPKLLKHFLTRFAEREAIVLCGHTHLTELFDWYGYGGRITQMTMNSVWAQDKNGEFNIAANDPQQYGPIFASEKDRKAGIDHLYAPYKEGVKRYMLATSAGSYKLNVSHTGVTVDFYAGCSKALSHQFVLR